VDEPQRSESVKPFDISKGEVWRAYQKVKENKGAPGVDKEAYAKPLTVRGEPPNARNIEAIGDTPRQMQHNGSPDRYKGGL